MDALTQQLMQQLSGQDLSRIGQQIGADEQTTSTALSAALPLLLSALANNASKPEEAQALHQALTRDHDGSILNNVSGFLDNPQSANGAGILNHVLGGQQPVVTQGLAQGTGLNSSQIGQLLQIAAPLVMGLLGQQRQQNNLDTNGLSAFLGGQQQLERESNPGMMNVLNTLLDTNRDGSALDEVLGMAGKLLGGK
ncbi:MAG: DUF937 domain-containing protein [Chloroflexi bacterium]|nr:DUF937 domain-containing protein [Chloroflexota bacterium]